jgi:hypothetical protein
MATEQRLEQRSQLQNRRSSETSRTTVASLPDEAQAAILSSIIDRVRLAKGWNRLQQGKVDEAGNYVPGEQDAAIITWYEILVDGGVPSERWNDCYRSAQQRRNELKLRGKKVEGIMEPNDLVVEWIKLKDLHNELDKTRMLPAHAAGTCLKCLGTGFERMPGNTVRPGCLHEPGPEPQQDRGVAFDQAAVMRAALKRIGNPQPVASAPVKERHGQLLRCSSCRREATTVEGWSAGDTCAAALETSATCPKCEKPSCVQSMNKMVCRNCLSIYECATCDGQMLSAEK